MPNFITQVDFSTQIKEYQNTEGTLSGSVNINQYTILGTDYSNLPLGVDTTTSGITATYTPITNGYFTGTTGSTTFYFNDTNMDIAGPYLSAITSSNSGNTQYVTAFQPIYTTIVDGNSFDVYFSGVSFDMTPTGLYEYTPGEFSGVTFTNVLDYVSATTYAWWFLKSGSTTWNEVKGRTKTDRITIVDGANTGYILTSLNSDGDAVWTPNSAITWTITACTSPLYVSTIEACPNPSDTIEITAGGVGINMSPNVPLQVSGDTIVNSDYMMLSDTDFTIPSLGLFKGFIHKTNYTDLSGYFSYNLNDSGFTGVYAQNDVSVLSNFGVAGSQYVRPLTPLTGTDFYKNKSLLIGRQTQGLVINPNSFDPDSTIWFEISDYSAMILKGSINQGFLGLGLNPDGTELPTSNLQIGGTGTTGSFQYIDGNQQSGYVLTSDANGNATWQLSSGGSGSTIVQFTGNTSATCISDIYVTNVHGCSPISIQPISPDDIHMVMGGGNIGIGTTSPSSKLHLLTNSSSDVTFSLKIENSNAVTTLRLSDAGGLFLEGTLEVNSDVLVSNTFNTYGKIRPNYYTFIDSGTTPSNPGEYSIPILSGWVIEQIQIYTKVPDSVLTSGSLVSVSTLSGNIWSPTTSRPFGLNSNNIVNMLGIYGGSYIEPAYFPNGDSLLISFVDPFGSATDISDGTYGILITYWDGYEIL